MGAMHSGRHILVSGSHGLIGSAVVEALVARGDRVTRIARGGEPAPGRVAWDPESGTVRTGELAPVDGVVHLAGAGVADRRWNAAYKRLIDSSRGPATRGLVAALAGADRLGGVFACASAVGYYGDRGEEEVDEDAPPGEGFLAGVCRRWEEAARTASAYGARVVSLRFGAVLAPHGGLLAKVLPLARLGLGGPLGDGRQFFPWIALADAVGVALASIDDAALGGPINVVAPEAVRQREFAAALGRVLGRPALVRTPAFALRLAMGELADEALGGARVVPRRLLERGYPFRHPRLEPALREILARPDDHA